MEVGSTQKPPLMFIHGAWLSARSWENFIEFFEARGYDVSAPEWPRKEGDVEELRESADEIKGLGLDEIVDHYEAEIQASRAARPHRPLVRRPDRRTAARPRTWTGRGRDEPRSSQGNPRAALLVAQGGLAGPRAPLEVARHRRRSRSKSSRSAS